MLIKLRLIDFVVQNDVLYNIEILKRYPIQKFKKLILELLCKIYIYIYYAIFFAILNSLSVNEILFFNFVLLTN